jgi:hypothetical protein
LRYFRPKDISNQQKFFKDGENRLKELIAPILKIKSEEPDLKKDFALRFLTDWPKIIIDNTFGSYGPARSIIFDAIKGVYKTSEKIAKNFT